MTIIADIVQRLTRVEGGSRINISASTSKNGEFAKQESDMAEQMRMTKMEIGVDDNTSTWKPGVAHRRLMLWRLRKERSYRRRRSTCTGEGRNLLRKVCRPGSPVALVETDADL